MKICGRVILVLDDGCVFVPFIAITFGFSVASESVAEDTGTVTLVVSVTSGTLDRDLDISYSTVDLTSTNAATSKMPPDAACFIFHCSKTRDFMCIKKVQWVLDYPNSSMPVNSQHWSDK